MIFKTKSGQLITFKKSPVKGYYSGKEDGWLLQEVSAFIGAKKVGYLKVSYIPKKKFEKHYPTVLQWLVFKGRLFKEDLSDKDKIALRLDNWGVYKRLQSIKTEEDRKLWIKDRSILLNKVLRNYEKDFLQFKKFHVGRPLVDFIHVEPEWRRQGIAFALYQETAQWLAKSGLALHASGIQQPGAKAAWEKMKQDGLPIIEEDKRTLLDYR